MIIIEKRLAGLQAAALQRFLVRARRAVGLSGAVNVLLTSSVKIRALNRAFLGKNQPTDVLSFPPDLVGAQDAKRAAGEIAISADIALQNALRLGHSATDEIKILALHGLLHLAGFDHERDNGEMARMEGRLRKKLRLPEALIERAGTSKKAVATRRRRPGSGGTARCGA